MTVTGILVVHDGAAWLQECLDCLSLQTRSLDRLLIVDTGSSDDSPRIAASHVRIRQVVADLAVLSAPPGSTFGDAVGWAVRQLTPGPESSTVSASASSVSASGSLGSAAESSVSAAESSLCLGSSSSSESSVSVERAEWLWLLHDDSAAAPQALGQLLDTVGRSPSVGVAGPKLLTWEDPSRLLEVGAIVTRSGRRVGVPSPGEPDQGQHDHRHDVLGVSTSGMLVRLDVFEMLDGFDPAFGQFGDDLDLCWRAQLAGHRVVVAPRARMREAAASFNGQRVAGLSADAARVRERRNGRQVALARCPLYAAPVLVLWIALASLGSAAFLLVAKRPRGAWAAIRDLESLMTPWRPLAARWRARRLRRVRRRDLRGLFASPRAAFGTALDFIHDDVVGRGTGRGTGGGATRPSDRPSERAGSMESGPASEDAESLEDATRGVGWRILRHPGLLAVSAASLAAAVSWRSQLGSLSPSGLGVTGGELLASSGDASHLWHSWLDGWHGAGLGNSVEPAPYLPVLSAGAWVVEHLPLIGASTSPVGVSVAWLLASAIPLSAWSAYLAARVVTLAPWPRAWAALAWASLATLTTAVAAGRLGGVVAHILLPLVAAGFVYAARRSARAWGAFGGAAALAVTGAFSPVLGVCGAVASATLLVFGRGRVRLRAVVLLVVPVGLLGPWTLRVMDNPLILLGGPGLTVWRDLTATPWQLELLHPGGPGSYPVLLSLPIVLAGVIALSRRDLGALMTALAALTAGGLVLGVAAPHIIIGHAPRELAVAGVPITIPITMWSGTGLDLAALGLVTAALCGFARVPGLGWRPRWRQAPAIAVVAAAASGVAASLALVGWSGVGDGLSPQVPTLPAIAQERAGAPEGSRLLAITRRDDTVAYRLVGAEPGPVVRDLPVQPGLLDRPGQPALPASSDPLLEAAVKGVVGANELPSPNGPRDALADLGIGFVTFQGSRSEPLVNRLDATAGMARLGSSHGVTLWRVLPGENGVGSPRLRLVDAQGRPLSSIAVSGDHAQTAVHVAPAVPVPVPVSGSGPAVYGRRLVVAEPRGWTPRAQVTFAGHPLVAIAGAGQPTYAVPTDPGELSVTLVPTYPWWRWTQLGLLFLVLFLAAPFGPRRSRRTS